MGTPPFVYQGAADSPWVGQGLAAARPTFGNTGALFFATDTKVLSFDTGTAWATWAVLGVQGAQGAQGAQGFQGAQGAQGAQGPQGFQGA